MTAARKPLAALRIVLALTLVATAVAPIWRSCSWCLGSVMFLDKLSSIRGASKNDVLRTLGKPSEVNKMLWIYDRPLNRGWVEIWFDENEGVQNIIHEQEYPDL